MVTDIPVKIQIVKSLSNLKPSRIMVVKPDGDSDFSLYVTDKGGIPYPLKSSGGSITNTDGNLTVTGSLIKIINLNPSLLTLINSALKTGDNVSGLVNDAGYLTSIDLQKVSKIAAENINSHTPVAIVNNLAYKLDSSNPLHSFAFAGFSEVSSTIGNLCTIKQIGEITLNGWGLIPNKQYLAGINGTMITENLSNTNFTKIIGYATTVNSLQIIKDSLTINK